jgi:hypothetical protein
VVDPPRYMEFVAAARWDITAFSGTVFQQIYDYRTYSTYRTIFDTDSITLVWFRIRPVFD